MMLRTLAVLIIAAIAWLPQFRFVISGRIADPHGVRPPDMMLSLAYDRDGQGLSLPVTMTKDGAFATQTVYPGNYVLMAVRNPYSHTERSMPIGLEIVTVGQGDTHGVTVTIQRDYALEGRFRINAGTPRRSGVIVQSCLAVEGVRRAACLAADEAPDGRFVLRNAYGPRLLTVVTRGADSASAARARVLLDGRDITNVPTDFSQVSNARLEIQLSAASR